MIEHGEHAVCIAVPVDLLRALIDFAYGYVVYDADVATVEEAAALLPQRVMFRVHTPDRPLVPKPSTGSNGCMPIGTVKPYPPPPGRTAR